MDIEGKVVVVTGGAGGIGRAMAERFADEGARGVVVADLDADAARRVASELGERWPDRTLGVGCDVTVERQVVDLVDRTEDVFGPVDLFCANAGLPVGTDPSTSDEDWTRSWNVHLMALVYAVRRLLPGWLERGSGYFLATASAAGLLTQIGSAPYSVTKHATVAFAEWLAVTYGDQGVGVSCLCPMGVRTALLDPEGLPPKAVAAIEAGGDILQPGDVASAVVEALHEERFLVLPHPEVLTYFQRKAGDYDRWIGGMRKLQARLEPTAEA